MSVLYIRDKTTGKFVPIKTIQGPKGDTGAVEGLEYHETAPSALGAASPGVSDLVARGDHVHPKPTPAEIGAATALDVEILTDAVNQRLYAQQTLTINASDWMGISAPYRAEIPVEGMLETDVPVIDVVLDNSYETAMAQLEDYSAIYRAVASEGKLTLYATDKPTNGLTIQIMNI